MISFLPVLPCPRRLLPLLGIAMLLSACEGDRGSPGPSGPSGPPGPPGPPSPTVGAPVSAAERIHVSITTVTVPQGGGAPVVEFSLSNDSGQGLHGLPDSTLSFAIAQLSPKPGGGSSEWQSYIARDSAGIVNAQASTEAATAGAFTDNGDGTYRYIFSQGLTAYPAGPIYDPTKTHRLGLEIRTSSGGFRSENVPAGNAPFEFVPGGGAPLFSRRIVGNAACNACHDALEAHGEARFDVEYCVLCHNPSSIDGDTGNSVDMKIMIHKIHRGQGLANGYEIIGFGNDSHDFSDVVLPQDIRNCDSCHDESDIQTPDAQNWRLVANRAACGSCHDDIDWANAGHPGGLGFSDDAQCLDCHGPNATVTNSSGRLVRIPIAHEIPAQLAGEKFEYRIEEITDTAVAQYPRIRFSVVDPSNGDTPYDLASGPAFTTCAMGSSRLAVVIAWSTDEFSNRGSGNDPSQPVSINPLPVCGGASQPNPDGSYTVVSPVAVPTTATGSLAVALEGHPYVDLNGDGLPSSDERIPVTSAIEYAAIDTATAESRRRVVDINKCNDCHDRLSVHGNNRTDQPEVCATCHNGNATDIGQRGGQCLADLGGDDASIDLKYLIHRIHASGRNDAPYAVCGFDYSTHVFEFDYPGKLNNCEGCHREGSYYPLDAAEVLATTIDAGTDLSTAADDTAISPNTAVCSSCHSSALALEHMLQNGADFAAGKTADGALVSSSVETCALCHGPGRLADVKEVHGIAEFRFND